MSKPGKYGDLNFHPKRLRWYKKIKNDNGNYAPVYFGPKAKSAQDRKAKKAALIAWESHKKVLETNLKAEQYREILKLVKAGALPINDLGDTPFANALREDYDRKGMVTAPNKEGLRFINPHAVDPDARDPENHDEWDDDEQEATIWADDPVEARRKLMDEQRRRRDAFYNKHRDVTNRKPGKKTVNKVIDAWLEDERTTKSKKIKQSSLDDKTDGIKTFRVYLAQSGTKYFGKSEAIDELLMNYRTWLLDQMNDSTSRINSPNTVNDKTKFGGQLIRWAHKVRELKELPRRLDDFTANLPVTKGGKPLPITDIHKIWAKANPRWRCFMLIALNCGMKNSEIAGLRGKHLQGKRLMGIRAKTKEDRVLFNFALWPSTLKAIKANRDNQGDNELLFNNRTGGEITTQSFSSSFKKICKEAGAPEATFERLKDTSVKLVKATIHQHGLHRSYNSLFQMHRDAGTNEYYDDNTDPEQLRVPKLDKVVLGLEKTYGLKLDEPSIKATASKKVPAKPNAKKSKPKAKTPAHPELGHLRSK